MINDIVIPNLLLEQHGSPMFLDFSWNFPGLRGIRTAVSKIEKHGKNDTTYPRENEVTCVK